jgi:hypothetical protein
LLAFACVFLLALNKAYSFTLGALLRTLAAMFRSLSFRIPLVGGRIGLAFIGDAIDGVDHYVLLAIGSGIVATEKGLHALIGWMTWLLQETADQVAGLAEDTAHAFNYVRSHLVPTALKAALLLPSAAIALLQSQVGQLLRHPTQIIHATTRVLAPGLSSLRARVDSLEKRLAATGAAAVSGVAQLPAVITVPNVTAIPGDIYRGIDDVRKRIGNVARVLTPAGIVGLVGAAVLSQFELGWLRCKGVGRVGKGLCGLSGLIETLFADAIDALIVADLCQFTEALSYAATRFEPVLIAFVDVESALIGCHGITAAPAIVIEAPDLPPVTGYVLA